MSQMMVYVNDFSARRQRIISDVERRFDSRFVEDFADKLKSLTIWREALASAALKIEKEIQFDRGGFRRNSNNINVRHREVLRLETIVQRPTWQAAIMFRPREALFGDIRDDFTVHDERGAAIVASMNS